MTRTSFDADGVFVGRTEWEPCTPTPGAIDAAKRWLTEMAPLLAPARDEAVRQWVIALALQTAGRGMSAADAEAKAMAYATTLCEEPAHSFTMGTLKAAARHFKWFPSVAEIVEFVRKQTADRHGQHNAALRLASSSPVENAQARYTKPPAKVPRDVELRRKLSHARVRRFGQIPADAETWRAQMAACAAEMGVASPWDEPGRGEQAA